MYLDDRFRSRRNEDAFGWLGDRLQRNEDAVGWLGWNEAAGGTRRSGGGRRLSRRVRWFPRRRRKEDSRVRWFLGSLAVVGRKSRGSAGSSLVDKRGSLSGGRIDGWEGMGGH
ncbi:unnamed protein product [Linum trigynum]